VKLNTSKIGAVNLLVDDVKENLAKDESNFSLKLELRSLEYHLEELQTQLRHEKTLRDREVIECRLKGDLADSGTIPIDVLANISKHISGSLHSLAYRLKKGFDPKSRIPIELLKTLNLRLAGLGYGSTKLYFSATLNPNLFGYSLIEDSLQKTFGIFNSGSSQELTDSVSEVGPRSASNINRLLKTLTRYNLEAEISWTDPNQIEHKWEGSANSILQISNTLDTVINSHKESVQFIGEVIMLHKKGRFEIRTENDITYRGYFPLDILDKVTKVRVGEYARGEIEIETTMNKATGYEKTTYILMSLEKTNKNSAQQTNQPGPQ
jgi:hypothetical protein